MCQKKTIFKIEKSTNKNSRKVLVTGATGFIGHQLVKFLSQSGRNVLAVSRTRSNIRIVHPLVEWSCIPDLATLNDGPSLDGVDSVVHLAARVHIRTETSNDPLAAYRQVNLRVTELLAKVCARSGVRRFVFISSVGVNGNNSNSTPFTAEATPSPHNAYTLSKWEAEQRLFELGAGTGMEIVCIRPPLVYGPRVKANFLLMMRWLTRKIPLPLASANSKKSLVSITNLVDLILICLDHPDAANQTFLVSDDEDISTSDLLRQMGALLRNGKIPNLLPVPIKLLELGAKLTGKEEMARSLLCNLQVDISKTKRLLGWKPPISLSNGLKKTAEWYLDHN